MLATSAIVFLEVSLEKSRFLHLELFGGFK